MTIDSLSNALKTADLTRSTRDKSRSVKPIQEDKAADSYSKVDIIRSGTPKAFEQAASFSQSTSSQAGATLNEKSAIEAYQSIEKSQQREGIQLLLGVDTFV
ncbi:hypothetical protein [Paraglaciecola sp. 2405UD69-4]|uniref:hypothetical protein n=1 Tax=Paraglaciecola sp. 2405UD69-4 TaxID=3391836 RepID=UPI0039C8F8B0